VAELSVVISNFVPIAIGIDFEFRAYTLETSRCYEILSFGAAV